MIDLHCHTAFSDGSTTPRDLVDEAILLGLEALAITDHDTLEGYDLARPRAKERGLELVCGVELSTRCAWSARSAHVLGYFPSDPGAGFRRWLKELQNGRHQRNQTLLHRLHSLGVGISWSDLQAIAKKQVGRPHFARLMVEKGYAGSMREAFDRYLGEDGLAWVDRDEPAIEEAIKRVADAGGIASLAHPVRVSREREVLNTMIVALAPALQAIECFHPEHSFDDTQMLLGLAAEFGLAVTGGSDYHGTYKPDTQLGTGRGSLNIPIAILDEVKARCCQTDERHGPELVANSGRAVGPSLRVPSESGLCLWFTGLPCAGKSSIAEALLSMFSESGMRVTVLDGDAVRLHLSKGLGFSREDRNLNVERIGFVASEVVKHRGVAICAAVSPYRESRDRVRQMMPGGSFVEVFVDTPLEVCEHRDVKGHYAKARAGHLSHFTGVDDPYERPHDAEIVLRTEEVTVQANALRVMQFLVEADYLHATSEDGEAWNMPKAAGDSKRAGR